MILINLKIVEKECEYEKIQKLKENVIILNQALQKLDDLTKRKEKLMDGIDFTLLSLDEIQEKEVQFHEESSKLYRIIDQLFQDKAQYANRKSELEKQEYQAQQLYETVNSKHERKKAFDDKIEKLQTNISEMKERVKKLNETIEKLNQERLDSSNFYSRQIDELEKKRDEGRSEYQNCCSLIQKIRESKEMLDSTDSDEILKELNDLQSQYDKKEDELIKVDQSISSFLKKINSLEDDVAKLNEKQIDLELQKNYYKRKELYDSIKHDLEVLQRERLNKHGDLQRINIDELKSKLQEMQKEMIELKTNRRNNVVHFIEEDTESKKYESSKIELSRAILRQKVIEASINDIKHYKKKLNESIVKYHDDKIADINDIIHNLWQNIYYGQDVDSIAIRCEGEVGNSQYNYRVVMIRNEYEMDMNKCCSAGQRALASIIIRLALAQTFAISCPIIALDEPTTNLDESNFKNLALQLISLSIYNDDDDESDDDLLDINKKTFQIIIITHNCDFVKTLVEEGMLNSFYQITRDKDGCHSYSKIKRFYELNLIAKHYLRM